MDHAIDRLVGSRSLMAKHLPSALQDLGLDSAALPARILDVVKSGLVNTDSKIGLYATDAAVYTDLAPLLHPIIHDYHRFDADAQRQYAELESAALVLPDVVPGVLSSRVRCARNLVGFPFPPAISYSQRKELERVVLAALQSLTHTEFAGEYYSFETISRSTFKTLVRDHWVSAPTDRYLAAGGFYRDYPSGRGIFIARNHRVAVLVNEEDGLRIVAKQPSGRLRAVAEDFFHLVGLLNEQLSFIRDDELGYLASCPSNIGTGLRASVHVRFPDLPVSVLESHIQPLQLQVRGEYGETDTLDPSRPYDISNRHRLGLSEVALINWLYQGVTHLYAHHHALRPAGRHASD